MSKASVITDEDREAFALLSEVENVDKAYDDLNDERIADVEDSPSVSHSISVTLCEALQKSSKSAYKLEQDLPYTRDIIYYHQQGRCKHEFGMVDRERCAVMREMARDGLEYKRIADHFDVSNHSATYHITGDCQCNHTVDSIPKQNGVTVQGCARMRSMANYADTLDEIADVVGLSRRAVSAHVSTGQSCKHDDEPDHPPRVQRKSQRKVVTPQLCDRMRELGHDGWTQPEIVDRFDAIETRNPVRYHTNDDCTCANEVKPVGW